MSNSYIVLNPPKFGYTLSTNFTFAPDDYTAQNYNQFYWDLGDGTTSTQISGNHIYSSSNNYTIALTAYNVINSNVIGVTSSSTSVSVSLFNTNYNNGFANATNFQFTTDVQLSALGYNTYYWNFGDNSSSIEPNPKHLYTLPNNYNVTLTVYDSAGNFYNETHSLNVELFLSESIYFEVVPPPTFASHYNRYPFKLVITSSSTEPHYIDLAAQYSKSYQYQEPENNWSFLRPQWRFLDVNGNQIDSIKTIDSPIAIDDNGKLDPSANVIGVSGYAEFYFIDDLYNTDLYLANQPYSTIIATLRTSGIRSFNDSYNTDNNTPSFSNSLATVSVPHIFNFREPDYISITQNGISPISKIRFIGQDNPILINLKVDSNYNFDYIEDGNGTLIANLNEFVHYIPADNTTYYKLFSSKNIPFSLSAVDLAGNNLNFIYKPSALQFEFKDSNGFLASGYYKGSFVNNQSSIDCQINASGSFPVVALSTTTINPVLWISNPNAGMLAVSQYQNLINLSSKYINTNTFNVPVIQPYDIEFQSNIMSVSGIHGINSIAALPLPSYHAWATDTELNRLYRFNVLGDIIVNVDLNNIVSTLQYSNTALNFLIPNQLSPVSLAIDSNENVWVACFDTPYVLKFDKFGKYIQSITFNSYPINNPDFLEAWVNQSNKWVDVNSLPSNYTNVDVDDTYPIQPTCVDTDINNNIWVTYSNPFSGWLVKYSTTGSLLTSIQFPYYNSPYEIVCDNKNNLWVSTNNELENLGVNNGYLYYINGTTGAILTSFGHFNSINNLTIDNNQNLWFTYSYHYVGSINANNGNTITFPISSTTYSNNAPDWFNPNVNADESSLAGISSDFLNRIYVINSIENTVYVIDSNSTQIIDQFHIQPKGFNPYLSAANTGTLFDFNNWTKSAQANGDWSGFRWINKYPNNRIQGSYTIDSNGVTYKNIVGSTSANYINFYPPNYYDLYKINENFNMAGQMQSVSFQERLNQSENLFNFLSTIFGLSSHNDLGVKAYEKTANYTANLVDIDTCNVNNLYDLAESVDLNTDDFRLNYPVDIQRSIDLLSINQSRLFGSVLNDSFNFSTPSKYNNFNRGDLLDTTTYTVTAGVPVVLKAKSLNSYRLVPTGEVPLNDDIVSNLTMNGLTSYSLDTLAYFMGLKNSSYPWTQLYEFYEFVPSTNEIYAQNTVDWNNQFMNIDRDEYLLALTNQISGMYPDSYLNWNNNNGMMEFIFTYQLYKGFGLI